MFLRINPIWIYDIFSPKNNSLIQRIKLFKINNRLKRYSLSYKTGDQLTNNLITVDLISKFKYARLPEIKFFIYYFSYFGYLSESLSLFDYYFDKLTTISTFKLSKLNNNQLLELSQLSLFTQSKQIPKGKLINNIRCVNLFPKLTETLKKEIDFYSSTKRSINSLQNSKDLVFARFLKDKKIAIVGPKIDPKVSSETTNEILDYDIVIVPSYLESNFRESVFNVHVSYYNYNNQDLLIKKDPTNLRGLEFIVLKGNNLKNTHIDVKFREAIMSPFPWVVGAPNMTQIILFDLIHFSPRSIKLFGIDFYAGDSPYFSGYPTKVDDSIRISFAEHNLISNLRFVKHFLKLSYIQIDSIGQSVLNMTEIEYLDVIKKRYYH